MEQCFVFPGNWTICSQIPTRRWQVWRDWKELGWVITSQAGRGLEQDSAQARNSSVR